MATPSKDPVKTVFILHGFMNRRLSMRRFAGRLSSLGYGVVNLNYPSRSKSLKEHAEWLGTQVQRLGEGDLYFIGHSMGSIVIRIYLSRYKPDKAKRFVMIAPPNRGSRAADRLRRLAPYRLALGNKAGRELQGSHREFWDRLPSPPVEFGILAGGRGDDRGINPFLKADNDGTLLVSETRLAGAKDFALVPYQHTVMLLRTRTVDLAVRFLETGTFQGD